MIRHAGFRRGCHAQRPGGLASLSGPNCRLLIVFYVGDYDPSGMAMSEIDIPTRIARYGGAIEVRRLAITDCDTRDAELSWFSADEKRKDPRYAWFVKHYGHRCWELDAMSPVVLRQRLEDVDRGRGSQHLSGIRQ